jgi:uncharacterized protein (UPF0262 family)
MSDFRVSAITLDEQSVAAHSKQIEQERTVAISDLLEDNLFRPQGSAGGPYSVTLSVQENRLLFDIFPQAGEKIRTSLLLSPLRSTIRDYFLICDNYFKAIRTSPPHQIEALDMGRRALHDEGATHLRKRLEGKIETDFATARRLFTLICVLHLKA